MLFLVSGLYSSEHESSRILELVFIFSINNLTFPGPLIIIFPMHYESEGK